MRDREAVNAAIGGLPDGFGDIDILVNNAGLSRGLDGCRTATISTGKR